MARDLAPDWILQGALAEQDKSAQWFKHKIANMSSEESTGPSKGLTLTVIGCGTLGTAILGGIFEFQDTSKMNEQADSDTLERLPTIFNACVRSDSSAARIRKELGNYKTPINVRQNDNVAATKEADVVILGCKPYATASILGNHEMRDALKGKLLISILAGVPETQIASILYPSGVPDKGACTIIRAMPNTAASIRESMTVLSVPTPPPPAEQLELTTWIFSRIGRVSTLPPNLMDAATALCGSGPAFTAVFIESLALGAIAMGIPKESAYEMAAQTVRGMTGLVLGGEHPAVARDRVSSPGGCTVGGLVVLEEGGLRGTVSRAVREATVVASQLGEGGKNVNGTRR
ncbi:delta 1-pyrroline-5-carboxylate reductase [Oleoguttula sp. CCFEE 5521]